LVGRQYSWGSSDCLTVVRDWYQQNGIKLKDWPRGDAKLWDAEPFFETYFEELGFRPHYMNERHICFGDGILMSLGRGDGKSNHCAVYIGNGQFLHHIQCRLSSIDVLGENWTKFVTLYLRHQDAPKEWRSIR